MFWSGPKLITFLTVGFLVHIFFTVLTQYPAETNLSLAQRHYRSRVEELRELILAEENKFKLEYVFLKLFLGLMRKSIAGRYSEKLRTSEQEYGIRGFHHEQMNLTLRSVLLFNSLTRLNRD